MNKQRKNAQSGLTNFFQNVFQKLLKKIKNVQSGLTKFVQHLFQKKKKFIFFSTFLQTFQKELYVQSYNMYNMYKQPEENLLRKLYKIFRVLI
jgi:hypothetical protein